jgi:hypothetical protein
MLELGRADIGFGRIVLDDDGVTREKLIRRQHLAWSEIDDYRLTLEAQVRTSVWTDPITQALDLIRAIRGRDRDRVPFSGIDLHGGGTTLTINWRFDFSEDAIAFALARIAPRLTETARTELRVAGSLRFGPLGLARHALVWDARAPLPCEQVEVIAVSDESPARLVIRKRGKAFPWAATRLARIPNLVAALELAAELGYAVEGRARIPGQAPPAARVI